MENNEFKIEEKITFLNQYMIVFAHTLKLMLQIIEESNYNPPPQQIKAMKIYLKDKIKDLDKWN